MSTTEKTHLETVVEALVVRKPLDPVVEKKIHDEAALVQAKFDTEVSLEALRQIRDE